MQPVTFLDESDIYIIAPRKKNSPQSFLSNPHFEVLSNPDKFRAHLVKTASQQKTFCKKILQRLVNVDG